MAVLVNGDGAGAAAAFVLLVDGMEAAF